jgi:hypothetical protein
MGIKPVVRVGAVRRGAVVLLVGLVLFGASAAVQPAQTQAIMATTCGSTLVAASSWYGGAGVTVRSNGQYQGTTTSCGVYYTYGYQWQCLELVDRFYQTKGWGRVWSGGSGWAKDVFRTEGDRTAIANGSITKLYRGDIVVWGGGAGHVAVIDTIVRSVSAGIGLPAMYRVTVVEQNWSTTGKATLTLTRGSSGRYTLSRSGSTKVILGIVHDSQNTWSAVTPVP